MAKSDAARSAEWRRRLLLKASIFDDLNAERAARIRQAFPGDERPEVRAVVEFFANYPRCQHAPASIAIDDGRWVVTLAPESTNNLYEAPAALMAMTEVSSLPCRILVNWINGIASGIVRDEVAEMRALGLWGRP